MSNSDFFSLFSEDEQSSESLTSFFEIERVPTFSENAETQNSLESLDDIFSNLTFTADEQPYLLNNLENQTENPLAEPLKEITRSPQVSSLSPLTPSFLGEHQSLLQEIEEYKQALIYSESQLEGQALRSQSTDQLITQQAEEISKIREQLAYTVAERQVYQEEAQRQQLQIETFAETIATSQSQTANLERECSLLQENCQEKGHQITALEHRLEELQARFQRQQRYAMQYKKALEQCLATPNLNPSSDMTNAIASLTGQTTSILPWSSQQLTDEVIPFKFTTKNDSPQLDSLNSEIPGVMAENSRVAPPAEKVEILEDQDIVTSMEPETPGSKSTETLPSKRDRSYLSFSIHSSAPTTRRSIDLPRFMRQPSVNS